jgi:hypothetical protein
VSTTSVCAGIGCKGCEVCQPRTDWFPPNVDPVRIGQYEMLNTSTSLIFQVFFSGSRWFQDRNGPAVPLLRVWPWRGLKAPHDALKPGESRKIGANMFLVNFSEGPDRPCDDE